MPNVSSDRVLRNFLDEICPLPIIADERMFHGDLAAMGLGDLRREAERLRLRLLLDPRPHPWLIERFQYVEREASLVAQ